MNDEHGFEITWSQPSTNNVTPAWNGPAPDAVKQVEQAPQTSETGASRQTLGGMSSAWGASQAEPVGWAGAHGDTAGELSRQPRSEGDFGWSSSNDGPQFSAPDVPSQQQPSPASSAPADAPMGYPTQRPSDFDAAPAAEPVPAAAPTPAAASQYASPYEPQAAPQSAARTYATDPHAPASPANPASFAPAPEAGYHTGGVQQQRPEAPEPAPQVVANNDDLPEDSLTIGRSRDNGIVLDDMLVSRRHVVITADDDGLLLRDVGSRNGTFVNGRRVEQTHLHEGDRIGIGASTFEVRDGWLVSV